MKQPFSIISLTETWLNEQNSENFGLSNYNFVCSNRVNKRGGGLGIYVSNDLNYKLRPDLNINQDGIIEKLFITIVTLFKIKNCIIIIRKTLQNYTLVTKGRTIVFTLFLTREFRYGIVLMKKLKINCHSFPALKTLPENVKIHSHSLKPVFH